ncbi:MAG: hypothetical protein Q9193_004371, partial [Seirophora villosa]
EEKRVGKEEEKKKKNEMIRPPVGAMAAAAAVAAGFNFTSDSRDPATGSPLPVVLCYDDRYAEHPPLFVDCQRIITHCIATGPNPSVRIPFSRRPLPGMHAVAPKYWVSPRTACRVTIDVPDLPAESVSLQEIQATADFILMKCVLAEPHLGGFTMIGENNGMLVEVLGCPPRGCPPGQCPPLQVATS